MIAPLLAVEAHGVAQVVLDTGSLAAAGTAVFGFALLLWRYLVSPARRWLLDVHRVVTQQLQPNSGSSLYDRLQRVESTLDRHAEVAGERLERVEQVLDEHVSNASAHHAEQHRAARRSTER